MAANSYSGTDFLLVLMVLIFQQETVSLFTMLSQSQMFVLNAGENVSLHCEFMVTHFNLFDNPVLWVKGQNHELSDINIMGNIKEPFDSTDRLEVAFNPGRPRYMFTLSIWNLSLEDSGNYTCEVRGPKSVVLGHVTDRIFVRSPVTEVSLSPANGTVLAGDMLLPTPRLLAFVEDIPRPVRCIAIGGNPPPSMKITVGKQDITDHFLLETVPRLSGKKGFRLIHTTAILWTDKLVMTSHDDSRKLKCTVTVPGLGSKVAATKIQVNYAPVLTCAIASAYMGDLNVYLSCMVKARPAITTLFWVIDDNGTTVTEGEVIDEYWTLLKQDPENSVIESQLYMRTARKQSFRKYTLVAENNVAVRTAEVDLLENFREVQTKPYATSGHRTSGETSRRHNGFIFLPSAACRLTTGGVNRLLPFVVSALCAVWQILNTLS